MTLDLRPGTASLHGHIDNSLVTKGTLVALKIWRRDRTLLGRLQADGVNNYRLDGIPPGDYDIVAHDTRTAEVLLRVTLRDGENRSLDLTPHNIAKPAPPRGFAVVRVFTEAGIPLPCEVYLEGPAGRYMPSSSQNGEIIFGDAPDTYTLCANYPEFQPLRQKIELHATDKDGDPAPGYQIDVQMKAVKPNR